MKDKVIVLGAGKSGISAASLLIKIGGYVLLYDANEKIDTEKIKKEISDDDKLTIKLGKLSDEDIENVSICVISPGIDPSSEVPQKLVKHGIQLWSEIQLGYHVAKGRLFAITGTNGKTTTTSLLGAICANFYPETLCVGNIGIPYTSKALDTTDNTVTVLEVSSFQLETIIDFRPNICAILNITPDHMDRHRSMENYISVKESITSNQTDKDYVILNYDDEILREFGRSGKCKSKVVFFSSTNILDEGIFIKDDMIIYKKDSKVTSIISTSELNILGRHNHENAMAAIAMSLCAGIPLEVIQKTCREFTAVPHRIEFVADKNGIKYYNDSKGTNPDAAIKAIKAMPGPTILIGGGYDKGSTYDEWIESFDGKVRYLVLLGQTRDAIADCAKKHGFTNIMYAESMEEAVKVCASYAQLGDYVLLSPACASWGMFENYEQRGDIFKQCVKNL